MITLLDISPNEPPLLIASLGYLMTTMDGWLDGWMLDVHAYAKRKKKKERKKERKKEKKANDIGLGSERRQKLTCTQSHVSVSCTLELDQLVQESEISFSRCMSVVIRHRVNVTIV